MKAYSPKGVFPSGSSFQPERAVTAYVTSGGYHPMSLACPWFQDAAQLLKRDWHETCQRIDPPVGERQTRPTTFELWFRDPPHVSGTGDPSGGPNPSSGFVLWYPFSSNRLRQNAAATATCELPGEQAATCGDILGEFRGRFRRSVGFR